MELLRALSEKKCLLEGRIHTQLCTALHKIVHNMPSKVISQSPNVSQEEAYDFASSRLDLLDHLLASVLTNVSNYEADTSNSSIADPNTVYISNTPPSAVVQTETNGAINEGPLEENVAMPVVISNQETQIDAVSADVAKEEKTLEGAVAQQDSTNVPATEQLAVELLDRSQETQQDPIKTVTVTPGNVKEEPTIENTVQHVVPIATVTRPQTVEHEDVHEHPHENATLHPATPPSAVVQTEENRLIKEGPLEENVFMPVAISNQETQIDTVSVGVANKRQTLESTVVQKVATKVSEPTANIERTNRESNTAPSAVVQTEANGAIKEGPVEENVTVPVQTQTVIVSAGVVKEEQTLESTAVQQVVTNVPAAEQQDQLTVELLDRNRQTQQDPIKTVTITSGDVIEPAVENTVKQVVPITTVTTRPHTEELDDVHHHSYENATLHPASPNEQNLSTPAAEVTEPTANIETTNVRR